jgi:LCP family protein required for cell wall assembly
MRSKKKSVKLISLALMIVFLLAAAFLLLKLWENSQGQFQGPGPDEDGTVEYQGKEYVLRDNIETFLVLGLDKYKDATGSDSHESGTVQADFLMLFVFDHEAKTTTAIQINRDTMANVNRLDIAGNKTGIVEQKQIALAYNYAYQTEGRVNCRNTADSVSDLLLGVKVNHYLSLTMDSVVVINDLVGGVEVLVTDDFTGIDDTLIMGQRVTLMGQRALTYVRSRRGMEDSTNSTRMQRQQQYMEALFDRAMHCIETDEEFLLKAADQVSPYIEYDSTEYRLKEFAERFDSYAFQGIRQIEGQSRPGAEFLEFYPDEDAIWELVIQLFYTPKTGK